MQNHVESIKTNSTISESIKKHKYNPKLIHFRPCHLNVLPVSIPVQCKKQWLHFQPKLTKKKSDETKEIDVRDIKRVQKIIWTYKNKLTSMKIFFFLWIGVNFVWKKVWYQFGFGLSSFWFIWNVSRTCLTDLN